LFWGKNNGYKQVNGGKWKKITNEDGTKTFELQGCLLMPSIKTLNNVNKLYKLDEGWDTINWHFFKDKL
jgi:hypothetical protein